MSSLCILCRKQPPIAGSHIIPNFFVRYLKRNSPVPYLKHSTAIERYEQDGWKGPFLCTTCEGKFSRWEAKLASIYRDIVEMRDGAPRAPVPYDDAAWSAVASIHFRWLHLARGSSRSRGVSASDSLYEALRSVCETAFSGQPVHLYMAALEPALPPSPRAPGFNTYAFTSIDGFAFDYQDPAGQNHFVSCVKPPGLCLVASTGPLRDLSPVSTDVDAAALSPNGGSATPFPVPGTFWTLFGPDWDGRASHLQASYGGFKASELEKIKTWAASPNAPPKAAEWYEADLGLLNQTK